MKQKLLSTMLLLFALIAGGVSSAWGVTGTINFGSTTGYLNVNSAEVSGNDDQGKTWTVTTDGTTSFTPNASYAQIGSSSKPATSITFTTTIADNNVNVTSFSAKFGGFSGTAGTITLKVGDISVGTGSLSATSDVTVSSTEEGVGTVLTVTVTGIAKGVKAYYITYTYENNPHTVTIGDDGSTLTEASGGAGVTLPSRSNIGAYTFAGWSTNNVTTETTTAPTIIIPAGSYAPTADITLYPVYTRKEGGGNIESSNIFESGSYANSSITWSIDEVVSITQAKGSGQTAPNSDYVSAPRWYSGNKITITPNVSINSISVTATTNSYATALANSTFNNATASANGTGVTITPVNGSNAITINMSGQSRLSSLIINYVDDGTTYYLSTPYVSVTITTAKYATFCDSRATDFSETGITVYKAKVDGRVVKLTAISDGIVPANTGVILYKDVDATTNVTVPYTTTDATISDNELVGTTERTLVAKNGGAGYYNYILQSDGNGGIVFNMATEGGAYMPANRAYLSTTVDASTSSARLSVVIEDDATGIESIENGKVTIDNEKAYNLQGQRVNVNQKGIVIVNGKKYINK